MLQKWWSTICEIYTRLLLVKFHGSSVCNFPPSPSSELQESEVLGSFENFNLWQTCQTLSQRPSKSTTPTLPQVSEFTGQDLSTIVGERMKMLLLPGQPTSVSSLTIDAFRVQVILLLCNFKGIACTQSLMRIEKTLDWTFPSTLVIQPNGLHGYINIGEMCELTQNI